VPANACGVGFGRSHVPKGLTALRNWFELNHQATAIRASDSRVSRDVSTIWTVHGKRNYAFIRVRMRNSSRRRGAAIRGMQDPSNHRSNGVAGRIDQFPPRNV